MKKSILIACIILTGMLGSAQVSTLLEKGKSGFGAEGIYETSHGINGFGGKIGGSVAGNLDIEFTWKGRQYDQVIKNLLTDDASSAYYEGKLTWWLVRKEITPSLEVNLGPFAGFDYGPYKNYTYTRAADNKTVTYKYYKDVQFGLATSVNFRIADSWILQPSLLFVHETGSQQEILPSGEHNYSDNGITSKMGFTVIKRFSKGCAIYLTEEEISTSFGYLAQFQISLGFVIPL